MLAWTIFLFLIYQGINFGELRQVNKIKIVSFIEYHFPNGGVDFSHTRFGEGLVNFTNAQFGSTGSVSDSYDNALAETINGLYKTEIIHKRAPWKTVDEVEYATLEWVDWFNNRRLLEPIGNIPPAEYEKLYYDQTEESAMVA